MNCLTDELRVATPAELDYQSGSFEIYQHPEFAEIFSRHYRSAVVDVDGLLIFQRSWPLIGVTRAVLGSPEVSCDCETWLDRVSDLNAGKLEVLTNQRCEQVEQYCISTPGHYNFVVDLRQGEEEIWLRMKKRCRNAVRRAEKAGLVVREAQSVNELSEYYEVLSRVSNKGAIFPIPDYPLIKNVFSASFSRLFIAEHNGQIVGGLFYLINKHVYGWAGAFDFNRANGIPSNIMYWKGILWALSAGYTVYDMGAQRLGENPNLDQFKKSFSPVLIPGYQYVLPQSSLKYRMMSFASHLKGYGRNLRPVTG